MYFAYRKIFSIYASEYKSATSSYVPESCSSNQAGKNKNKKEKAKKNTYVACSKTGTAQRRKKGYRTYGAVLMSLYKPLHRHRPRYHRTVTVTVTVPSRPRLPSQCRGPSRQSRRDGQAPKPGGLRFRGRRLSLSGNVGHSPLN